MDQEEENYGFHPWALAGGIDSGGEKSIAQGAEGEERGEEPAFDGDSYWGGDNGEEVNPPPSRVGRWHYRSTLRPYLLAGPTDLLEVFQPVGFCGILNLLLATLVIVSEP